MRRLRKVYGRKFIAYWFHSASTHISLGFHLDWQCPNVEVHLPFGFFRIGWQTLEEPWTREELDEHHILGYEGSWWLNEKYLQKTNDHKIPAGGL